MRNSLPEACGISLKITVERMLGIDKSQRELMAEMSGKNTICEAGLKGFQTFQQQIKLWPERENAASHARYVDNAIVKFGTGGGFFRNHYAVFMVWAREQRPDLVSADSVKLAHLAADQWNALSPTMQSIAAQPTNADLWNQAHEQVDDIYHTEYTLYGQLSDTVLRAMP
jgi:hypothetical protein